MNNQIQTKTNAVSQMTTFLSSNAVKLKVNNIVGTKDGDKLISNLVSNIQQNPTLAECSQGSIVNGALAGHALKLDFALQQAYLVPFKDNKTGEKNAQFCIGWKGYVQMALRSGQYKHINVIEIKEGELKKYNRLTEEYEIEWIDDDKEREKAATSHYIAYIELVNGYKKSLLWSKDKMLAHANKYSKSYQADLKYGTTKSFWLQDFDSQAKKTLIRQIISKWGVMSTEMIQGFKQDMAVIDEQGNPTYVDNANVESVEVLEETSEPVINNEQIEILCHTIVAKDLSVPTYMESKGIEDVSKITLKEYKTYMQELGEK